MFPFAFETLRYDEARSQWQELTRPPIDEVRWVKEEVVIEGDFSLDDSDGELFTGAWVFAHGLSIRGALTNTEMDSGPVLYVQQYLRAQRWWLTGCMVHIAGTLDIERLLIAEYNHGALVVDGLATVPLLLNLDFDVTLRRGLRGEYVDESERAKQYLPTLGLWESAASEPVHIDAPETKNRIGGDSIYLAATQLLEHWREAGKVMLAPDADTDALTNELAVMLEKLGGHYDPASALGEWLMENEAIEDVLVEDVELLPDA